MRNGGWGDGDGQGEGQGEGEGMGELSTARRWHESENTGWSVPGFVYAFWSPLVSQLPFVLTGYCPPHGRDRCTTHALHVCFHAMARL
jgi:hypothetical protein